MTDQENVVEHDDNAVPSPAPEVIDTSVKPEIEVASAAETPEGVKKPNPVQERINKLTREKYEARQETAALEARLKVLESNQPKPSKPGEAAKAPQEHEYEDYNDFQNAHANHIAAVAADAAYERFAVETRESEELKRASNQQATQLSKKQAFDRNLDTKRGNFEDFEDVAYGHQFINESMASRIFDMGKGPEVAYHLGLHLDEAEKIFAMNEVDQAVALDRLDRQVIALEPRLVSGAPDTITPINGAESVQKSPEDMSDDEWRKWRYAQINARNS
tara:strand:- start:731 stop:1558 length:828 start_codon:yes stop_codon:yes gene_type:complete